MGKRYIAKIDNLYLQGKDTTSDVEEADIFESETEPRQRINQMKKDGKLNKKAKITIKALEESKNKLFESIFKESSGDMSLEQYCDSVNSDAKYIEAFKDWVRKGIHGQDILSRSRWDEIWDDFGGTFYDDEEEEVEVTQFQVDVDTEKPLKVWKDGSKWRCSDGTTYMGYLKPQDVVYWLRKDYGRAWLVESTRLKERVLDFDTWDKYYDEGVEAYLAGKTLSEAPITGNAWFTEAWQEGWQHAKACDEEDARRAEAEEEYWEEYSSMQESRMKEIHIDWPGSKTFEVYDGFEGDVEFYFEKYGQDVDAGVNDPDVDVVEYIANRIDEHYPTENPMQYDSLIGEVRALIPKIDKNWNANIWGPVKESKIKDLYDDLTKEIRNFILHDDEMDSFSGFDSYEFAKEELFEKLSDKYQVTVDCVEELFSEIEYELAHEDEDIPFHESKVGRPRQRIKEDSLDDPDIDLSQSFEGKDLEILQQYQNDIVDFLREVTVDELSERGFKKVKFFSQDGYKVYSGGLFTKKVTEPGGKIYFTIEIGEFGKIKANGINYSAKDLANMLCKAVESYNPHLFIDIDRVYQAGNGGIDSGQWKIVLYHNVPEDVLENY